MRVIYLTTHKKMLDHTDQEYANLHNNEIQFRTFYIRKMGFPCSSAGKESAFNAGNLGLIPG